MKEKYCLDSIATFQNINQSPTNRSTTKQTFSFSKTPRFQTVQPLCPNSTYGGAPITRKDSGTGMGFGSKYDFTKSPQKTPDSGIYNIKSFIDNNMLKKKGFSLGGSREKIVFESYLDPNKIKLPGVGRYHMETENMIRTSRAPAFTMREKTKTIDLTKTIESQNNNPSPAHYDNNPQLSKTLYSSHFKKTSYSNGKSKRFFNADNKVPGPGDYQNPTSLSNIGKYLISNHKGGTNAKFNGAQRSTKFDECIKVARTKPGPGAYKTSSEFGQYDGDVYSFQNRIARGSGIK